MKQLINRLKSITKVQFLAAVLILAGLALMTFKGLGMLDFYKEVKFAKEHNFQTGNPPPELLRPWMTIRYISVAFAVPQKYLFDATDIQPREENSMIAINRLNNQLKLGIVDGRPAIMKRIYDAILEYRADPVVTGLIERKVTDWMTIQYIANSTGIPAETFFKEVGIPMDGNQFLPLGPLSEKVNYSGGPKALAEAIQRIVDNKTVQP